MYVRLEPLSLCWRLSQTDAIVGAEGEDLALG